MQRGLQRAGPMGQHTRNTPPLFLDLTPTARTHTRPHLTRFGQQVWVPVLSCTLPAWPSGEEPSPTAAPAHHDLEGSYIWVADSS